MMKYLLLSLLLCLNLFGNSKKLNKQHAEIISNIIDKRSIKYIKNLEGEATVILRLDDKGIATYKMSKTSTNKEFNNALLDFIKQENGKFYMKNTNMKIMSIDFKGRR